MISFKVYRYILILQMKVTTQGFFNWVELLFQIFSIAGNILWNVFLNTKLMTQIVPAFNTPEHKLNLGISGKYYDYFWRYIKGLALTIITNGLMAFCLRVLHQFTGFVTVCFAGCSRLGKC
jgi:hypothetical protein